MEVLGFANVTWDDIVKAFPNLAQTRADVAEQLCIEAKYQGYLKRQEADIAAFRKDEALKIPEDIDYKKIGGLSNEVVMRFERVRPATLGAASRISGITPAAVTAVLGYVKNMKK